MKLNAYASKTDKGPYLDINEDLFSVDLIENLFMLIDAFGGAGQGNVCAQKIADSVREIYSRLSDPDSTRPFFYAPQYLPEGNGLINAVLASHQSLYKENIAKKMPERAGAGGVFISFSENIINALSVGNCRAYLYSLGKMWKVFEEDSLRFKGSAVQAQMRVPLSAFGLYDYLPFTFKEVYANPGDYLILLTDGVYSLLDQDEIKALLEKNTSDLHCALSEMFSLANRRNNLDNQSGMILSF